ncbi:MAG: ABC transporter permease [Candidatus Melainabacteria bacterium]
MATLHFRQGILPIWKKVVRQEETGWRTELVNTIAIPLTFFLAFGIGLQGYIGEVEGLSYMAFLAPGLITQTLMMEAFRTGSWGLWLDRWYQKMLQEFRIKPISTEDIIIGEILGGFTVAVMKALVVGAILLMVAPVHVTLLQFLMYFSLVLPGCVFFTCLGCLAGTSFSKPDQIAKSQTIFITPLLYLGGLFFPITVLPEQILPVIRLLPTTAVFDGGRQALMHGRFHLQYVVVIWVCAALSFWVATVWFNKKMAE